MANTKRKYTKRSAQSTASSTTNGDAGKDMVRNAGRASHKAGKAVRKNAVIATEKAKHVAIGAAGVAIIAAGIASTSVRNFVAGLLRG